VVSGDGFQCFSKPLNQYKFILNDLEDLSNTEGIKNLFRGMTSIQKQELEWLFSEILKGTLFDFLQIFDSYPEFKILLDGKEGQIDLNKASDMLKAEPIIENGWIERYSNFEPKR